MERPGPGNGQAGEAAPAAWLSVVLEKTATLTSSSYQPSRLSHYSFRLNAAMHRPTLPQPMLHLLGDADHELISRLGLRRIDGVGRQLQHTFGLRFKGCDSKCRKIVDEMNDSIRLGE